MSTPLVKGGQGRSGQELADSARVVLVDALIVLAVLAVLALWGAWGEA